jgi:hypothetical protein
VNFELFEEVLISLMEITGIHGNNSLIRAGKELERAVAKVAKVCQKLVVVFGNEVSPGEDRVLTFRTVDKQVVAPDLGGNSSANGIISKNTSVSTLTKLFGLACLLINFIVEELSGADGV